MVTLVVPEAARYAGLKEWTRLIDCLLFDRAQVVDLLGLL